MYRISTEVKRIHIKGNPALLSLARKILPQEYCCSLSHDISTHTDNSTSLTNVYPKRKVWHFPEDLPKLMIVSILQHLIFFVFLKNLKTNFDLVNQKSKA
jgi:hypothetical protein